MILLARSLAAAMVLFALLPASWAAGQTTRPLEYTGVSLAGAEFGKCKPGKPGVYGTDYTYPTAAEADYFLDRGMNVIRLPFRWERLQPTLGKPFDAREFARLDALVLHVTGHGAVAILDPHDYARYYGKIIGGDAVPAAAFADFWRTLAVRYKGNQRVWFALVNEPHDLPGGQWVAAANTALAAIRDAGARNLVLVPGVAWTGAHSWHAAGNDALLEKIHDPLNHYAIEVHQYLDGNSSGQSPEVVSPTIGRERLAGFVKWCRKTKRRAFLGEFAAPATPEGRAALGEMLRSMEADRDVWLGFAWWAAGPWWGDNVFSIEPRAGADAPQLAWLIPHLQPVALKGPATRRAAGD